MIMVVKIQPAASMIEKALEYNDRKLKNGNAKMIATRHIDDVSQHGIIETFKKLERLNIRTSNPVFHASVNPGPEDRIDDNSIISYVVEYMDRLGYGNQPFVIYKHTDIKRTHYHIVSCRTDSDGRKINDSFENRKSYQIIMDLNKKYSLSIDRTINNNKIPTRFNLEAGNIVNQMQDIYNKTKGYRFTSLNQFRQILLCLGVDSLELPSSGNTTRLVLQGIDIKGKPVTTKIESAIFGDKNTENIMSIADKYKKERIIRHREMSRITNIATSAYAHSTSRLHFERILAKQGISVSLSADDNGKVFGVTFIDHISKCCFKASELKGNIITADTYNNSVASGKWLLDKDDKSYDDLIQSPDDIEKVLDSMSEGIIEGIFDAEIYLEDHMIRKKKRKRKLER